MVFGQRSVLVLGGASGIGYAIAERFHLAGHQVVVADINEDKLGKIRKKLGCDVITTDVRHAAQIEAAVNLAADFGSLDIAVNCAGVEGAVDFLVHQDDATLQRVMDINGVGLLFALKYELRQMIRQGHGVICSIASIYGLSGQPRWVPYSASKHAVVGATKAAALEVAHLKIRVNAVAPGPVLTPLLDRATGGNPRRPAGIVPMRRLGMPEDLAGLVEWLCSEQAQYMTGTIVPFDGGASAQISTTPDFSNTFFDI